MMHKFSYEHNIEQNRSNIRALHLEIIGKIKTTGSESLGQEAASTRIFKPMRSLQ